MKNAPITAFGRVIIAVCGIALIVVLFVPLWQIELVAPQYPEGLVLKMYPNKLGGNVEIINGLNHYIGMKTLHAENFVEFTVLPYIICFFAIFCFVAVFINKKNWLVALLVSFIVFGIVAMIDFYRWNYNYGHDLDPNAAIQVPGMSYQPPLIGYKQLLNFGAYSIPDTGGWIFIGVGLLLVIAVIVQSRKNRILPQTRANPGRAVTPALVLLAIALSSCNTGPQPIRVGTDACSFCKMTIADNRFGAEIITKKGKAFKFDDMHCLLAFRKSNTIDTSDIKETYLVAFDEPHSLLNASGAFLFKSAELRSPMGGNIANFANAEDLKKLNQRMNGEIITWRALLNQP